MRDVLKAALKPDVPADEQISDKVIISSEELCEKLSQVSECLKTFEADRAEEIILELDKAVCDGQDVTALLADIRSDIDDFEMNAAEEKVQMLMTQFGSMAGSDRPESAVQEKGGEA